MVRQVILAAIATALLLVACSRDGGRGPALVNTACEPGKKEGMVTLCKE